MRPPCQYGQWPHFENPNLYNPSNSNPVDMANHVKIKKMKLAVAVSFIN